MEEMQRVLIVTEARSFFFPFLDKPSVVNTPSQTSNNFRAFGVFCCEILIATGFDQRDLESVEQQFAKLSRVDIAADHTGLDVCDQTGFLGNDERNGVRALGDADRGAVARAEFA